MSHYLPEYFILAEFYGWQFMTKLQHLMNHIETVSFEIQFTVISGFKILLSALKCTPMIEELIQTIQANRSDAEIVLRRVQLLADNKPEAGYMHCYDIQVLVYLYTLYSADYPNLTLAAVKKVQETQGFFWAYKLAEYIQEKLTRQVNKTSAT